MNRFQEQLNINNATEFNVQASTWWYHVQYNTIQHSLFKEGNVINPMSYLTYGLQVSHDKYQNLSGFCYYGNCNFIPEWLPNSSYVETWNDRLTFVNGTLAWCSMSLPSRKVSDESLGRDETSFARLTTNNVFSQVTVNFIVNFSLVNLRCLESLWDIRRDCCHHFVSERDFGRDAQQVCQAERSLMSPLVGMKWTS